MKQRVKVMSDNNAGQSLNAEDYEQWLSKFEARKTTDDCYTPAAVYQAVLDWATSEYSLAGRRVVRPFIPNGDFESFNYQKGDVVIDNPPFSILTKIRRWYDEKGIDYLLFAPALTLFSCDAPCSIVTSTTVEYANGAKVNTSFITSMDELKVRTAPKLKSAIKLAVDGGKAARKLPKYIYPDNAITAALLTKISTVDFSIPRCQVSGKINRLESQKVEGKTLFGCGYLISDQAAAELKAAELKAAELKVTQDATLWELSDSERHIIKRLSGYLDE